MKFEKLEDLNVYAQETDAKIAALKDEAVSKDDVELIAKENADLKLELENTQKVLSEIKNNIKYEVNNKTEDETMHLIGSMFLAIKRRDMNSAYKYGLQSNFSESAVNGDWDVRTLSAPDLGTPLRGDSTTGSYLIPDEIANQIIRYNPSPSALMGQVTSINMSVRSITIPTIATNVGWTKVTNEDTAKTEASPTFGYATLTAATYAFWVAVTEELREDSVINIGQLVAQLGTEQWQYTFDDQFLNTTTTGLFKVAGTNVVTMGTGKTSTSDFDYAEAQRIPAALDTQGKRVGASWLMHATVQDTLRSWRDDAGRPYFVEATDATPSRLMGYPIVISDAAPDSTTGAGTAFIAFGPMSKLIHGNRVGLEVRVFNQTADAMILDREFIRLRTRQAFTVGLPGNFVIVKTAA